MSHYKHSRIKDLIVAPPDHDTDETVPEYAQPGVHLHNIENSEEALEDDAINVVKDIMRGPIDPVRDKLRLEAAKSSMGWIGKDGKKGNTTVFAHNAQLNQLAEDPRKTAHILDSLKEIALITSGEKIEGAPPKDD